MKCLYCSYVGSRVVDSRQSEDGSSIRRRRECEKCGRRFTTFEKAEAVPLVVIKKNRTKQVFSPEKLKAGIVKACEKRPVSMEEIDRLVDEIERHAFSNVESEITSQAIGQMVMEALKSMDEVAYARFSCVYHQVHDLKTFVDELERLIAENQGKADGTVR